ncbi:D-hydantoinase [Saccharata proteae CBS 121410]|uniref:D-hydantoinase n=1 Tax=Saccharata proteae CBS 121410 TaxID=1314787 RepID=A0A9P4HQT8_9PEZI|nr:D-hydantoinase [Saccharata proteae CBS 121410]
MTEYDLLIINGLVITDTFTEEYDLAIKDEKIYKLAPRGSFTGQSAKRTIDAKGGYVMPGGVDAHVHLAEPPLFGKGSSADNYESGSRSAIAGGTTTMITFAPQVKSEPSLLTTLSATHAKAAGNCYNDYSFHLLIANPSPTALAEFPILRARGISSLKIYMTYEALQLPDNQILDVLLAARQHKITTMVHAENGHIISWMTSQLEKRSLFAPKYHAPSHHPMAEIEATFRAICLSELIDAPILLVHVSSPSAAHHINTAQSRGLAVQAETCPQYLFLTRHDLDKPGFEGAKACCSPPPRDGPADHDAIWERLADGTFAVLSSDHCPFLFDDSAKGKKSCIEDGFPEGRFKYIPNGLPGIETRLPLVLSAGRLPLQKFVAVTAANPARLYGLWPRKGAFVEGVSDADVVVWYPEDGEGGMEGFALRNEMLHHDVDYTPYEGRWMRQWPRYTVLRGEVVWDREGGGVVGRKGQGRFLERGVSCLRGARREGEWDVLSA